MGNTRKMQLRDKYFTGLALVAALCFAVLSGLHAARPILPTSDLAVLGFSSEDICGYGADGESRDCPNCALVDGVCQSKAVALLLHGPHFAPFTVRAHEIVQGTGQTTPSYYARAPPKIT